MLEDSLYKGVLKCIAGGKIDYDHACELASAALESLNIDYVRLHG